MQVKMGVTLYKRMLRPELGIVFSSSTGSRIARTISHWEGIEGPFDEGSYTFSITLDSLGVVPGVYTITPWLRSQGSPVDDHIEHAIKLEIFAGPDDSDRIFHNCNPGEVCLSAVWAYE